MKLRDVHIVSNTIKAVTLHISDNELLTVTDDDGIKWLENYDLFSPYMKSPVATVFVYSIEMSIYLEDANGASDDHEDEMPELSNIRECINEFFDYAESCGVGALL